MFSLSIRSSNHSRNEFSGAEGERHDCQHWIKSAVSYMKRSVHDEQIVVIVNASPLVRDRTLRIEFKSPEDRLEAEQRVAEVLQSLAQESRRGSPR